jgi:DNA end-binding protein Ku
LCPREHRPLEVRDIVRGYEVEGDRFVVVDDRELEAIAPKRSREIDLRRFVALSEIDPMYFERAYYLAPAKSTTKAYRLLARTIEDSGRAGIATFVMHGKEYLVAIIAENGILRAETLRFTDELRTPEELGLAEPGTPDPAEVRRQERDLRSLAATELDPEERSDRFRRRLQERAHAKLEERGAVLNESSGAAAEGPDETDIGDLMAVLKRSLRHAGGGNGTSRTGPSRRRRSDPGLRSKDELYERARQLDIAGRSRMSKRELADAVGQASRRIGH